MSTLAPIVATRERMHGPLWSTDTRPRVGLHASVQLWAPNVDRDHWAVAWSVTEGDDVEYRTLGHGYEARGTATDALGTLPDSLQAHARALATAVEGYDPAEVCDHTLAHSRHQLEGGAWVCGYCGSVIEAEETKA